MGFMTNLTGLSLFLMITCSLINGFNPDFPAWFAGLLSCFAAIMLFPQLSYLQKIQVFIISSIGLISLGWSFYLGVAVDILAAISVNQLLLAMLAAVSFLRLINQPHTELYENLPQGRQALWQTLFSTHFFGAVINLSTILIIGDRLVAQKKLTHLQALMLSRGFATAAFWTPFFASTGLILHHAVGANLTVVVLIGLPVAIVSLFISLHEWHQHPELAGLVGYPLHFKALWLPCFLAVAVISLHEWLPQLSILVLITFLTLFLSLFLLLLRLGKKGFYRFRDHVVLGLPRMSGELLLFLAAGLLASGINSLLMVYPVQFPLETFLAWHGSLLILLIIGLAMLGVHPIVPISTLGGILMPYVADPTLLAISFMAGWGLSVASSPLSGLNLILHTRYGIDNFLFIRGNWFFLLKIWLIYLMILHLYEFFTVQ